MRLPLILASVAVIVLGTATSTAAFAQMNDLPREPVDPRDKYDPNPPSPPNPNRLNPRTGVQNAPDGPDNGGANPAVAASVQPVPGGADTLESMGGMAIYTPPSLDTGSTEPLSLPGMDIYTPPSADSATGAATSYPAWWPQ
ncbi:hypothetical protein [Sphingomonas oryzagri]|uniref:Uncharacterized protein n=1 Tax=Sphingomonas oryzagri TaxID=3042314 RepID=A0ABT6MYT5_9SPHN|nr:hypothetical protein [Sphingomonas oryzagri]MDH7637281.1 hypothetical protein [Sphingomonas oryzagri]